MLAYYRIPQALLANVSTWGMGPIAAGFFIAFCFLVVGCFLDAIPAIVIVGTVLEPLAKSVDLHPVQFAIISIVSLAFGLVTPPYGMCLMIACSVAGVRLRYAFKDTVIMLVPMLLRAGRVDHLARGVAVPAAPDRAGYAEIAADGGRLREVRRGGRFPRERGINVARVAGASHRVGLPIGGPSKSFRKSHHDCQTAIAGANAARKGRADRP